jgi:hypothetical protein
MEVSNAPDRVVGARTDENAVVIRQFRERPEIVQKCFRVTQVRRSVNVHKNRDLFEIADALGRSCPISQVADAGDQDGDEKAHDEQDEADFVNRDTSRTVRRRMTGRPERL